MRASLGAVDRTGGALPWQMCLRRRDMPSRFRKTRGSCRKENPPNRRRRQSISSKENGNAQGWGANTGCDWTTIADCRAGIGNHEALYPQLLRVLDLARLTLGLSSSPMRLAPTSFLSNKAPNLTKRNTEADTAPRQNNDPPSKTVLDLPYRPVP